MVSTLMFAGASQARDIAAYSGNPAYNEARSCFSEAVGAVLGDTCALPQGQPAHVWQVVLPFDSTGSKNVWVTASAGPNAVSCTPYGVNEQATTFNIGGQLNWVNQGPLRQQSSVNTFSFGSLIVDCTFAGTGGQVNVVNWTP